MTVYFWKADERYGYFCQWYLCTMTDADGVTFSSAEQYMMYHKAKTFNDEPSMRAIIREREPRKQKRLGRQVEGFNEETWDKVKFDIVVEGNMLKFTQGTVKTKDVPEQLAGESRHGGGEVPLKDALLATEDALLVEASKFDRTWGIGFTEAIARTTSKERWGENLLGKALMEVRNRLRKQECEKRDAVR